MIGKKYIRSIIYKYKRFHVWYNKKVAKHFHNSTIIDMEPYDYKAVRKMQRKCNDHWSNLLCTLGVIIIMIILFIIVYWLMNR